jgi:hypothetical protein
VVHADGILDFGDEYTDVAACVAAIDRFDVAVVAWSVEPDDVPALLDRGVTALCGERRARPGGGRKGFPDASAVGLSPTSASRREAHDDRGLPLVVPEVPDQPLDGPAEGGMLPELPGESRFDEDAAGVATGTGPGQAPSLSSAVGRSSLAGGHRVAARSGLEGPPPCSTRKRPGAVLPSWPTRPLLVRQVPTAHPRPRLGRRQHSSQRQQRMHRPLRRRHTWANSELGAR